MISVDAIQENEDSELETELTCLAASCIAIFTLIIFSWPFDLYETVCLRVHNDKVAVRRDEVFLCTTKDNLLFLELSDALSSLLCRKKLQGWETDGAGSCQQVTPS